jgi:hypothetical protein
VLRGVKYLVERELRQGASVNQVGETSSHAPTRTAPRFAQVRVGRLIEVRAPSGLSSVGDVKAFTAGVLAAMRQTGGSVLVCADYRRGSPLMPDAAGPWSHAMREANAHLIRSAVLIDPANTMFNLQIGRVVRCAGPYGHRRIFTDVAEMRDWLDDAATEAERLAIGAFLSRPDE